MSFRRRQAVQRYDDELALYEAADEIDAAAASAVPSAKIVSQQKDLFEPRGLRAAEASHAAEMSEGSRPPSAPRDDSLCTMAASDADIQRHARCEVIAKDDTMR